MLDVAYDYGSCVKNSEKVSWKLDDVMGPSARLDLGRPFLPESLSGSHRLTGFSAAERLKLNQITGSAYLNLFIFVEEYILAFAVQQASAEMYGNHDAIRSLLRFADEEVKHQQLFSRYRDAFERDFGMKCDVLGGAKDVAGVILGKTTLAVTILTLQLELMTQLHYTDSVRDATGVDPLFVSLLKHHWIEESQHARVDILELQKLLEKATPADVSLAFDEYFGLLAAMDGLLAEQAKLDAATAPRALGRAFTDTETKDVIAVQHAAYRKTFLSLGMKNPQFLGIVKQFAPEVVARIAERATELSPS
jgi:hypothetical protein